MICVPLVVLDEADYVVLLRRLHELVMVVEQLHGGLRDQDVEAPLNGIQGDGVVGACKFVRQVQSWRRLLRCSLSGVKIMTASPGESLSIASLSVKSTRQLVTRSISSVDVQASPLTWSPLGNSSKLN